MRHFITGNYRQGKYYRTVIPYMYSWSILVIHESHHCILPFIYEILCVKLAQNKLSIFPDRDLPTSPVLDRGEPRVPGQDVHHPEPARQKRRKLKERRRSHEAGRG